MYKISLVDKPAIEEDFIHFNEVEKVQMFADEKKKEVVGPIICLLYTSPSPRDRQKSRMPSSA